SSGCVQDFFPCSEIKHSLKTRDFKNACFLVKLLTGEADKIFSSIRSGVLTNDEIQRLVKSFINRKTDNQYVRDSIFLPDSDTLWPDLFRETNTYFLERNVDAFLKEKGVMVEDEEFNILCRVIANTISHIMYAEKTGRYRLGPEPCYQQDYDVRVFDVPTAMHVIDPDTNLPFPGVKAFPSGKTEPSVPADSKQRKLLSEVIQEFMREKRATEAWKSKTENENSSLYELFHDIVSMVLDTKDVYIDQLNRDVLLSYVEILKQIPSN